MDILKSKEQNRHQVIKSISKAGYVDASYIDKRMNAFCPSFRNAQPLRLKLGFKYKFFKQGRFPNSRNLALTWEEIVISLITYDSPAQRELLKVHRATWKKNAGKDLEIVLISDVSDSRSDYELKLTDQGEIDPRIIVYRSSVKHDGINAKYKVLDMFSYLQNQYGYNSN
eukprot:Pgem_evm1s12509